MTAPDLLRLFGLSEETLEIHALRPLNWQTERTIPDQLRKRSETSTHAESGGVVKRLLEAVVVEEDARGGVDVGEGVLGLAWC